MAERSPLPTDTEPARGLVEAPERGEGTADDPVVVTSAAAPPGPATADAMVRNPRALLWQARAGLGIGLLGIALAVFFFLGASDLRQAEGTRAAVLDAGETMALRVTTFDGAAIDAWVADTQTLATGAYADEVANLFDPVIRAGLADNQVQSVGEITSSFVQDVEEDEATVFAVIRQTFTSVNQPQAVSDELRMEIELDRVDGRWLTSEVAVLGPSTVSPVPGTDTPPAEAGS